MEFSRMCGSPCCHSRSPLAVAGLSLDSCCFLQQQILRLPERLLFLRQGFLHEYIWKLNRV